METIVYRLGEGCIYQEIVLFITSSGRFINSIGG